VDRILENWKQMMLIILTMMPEITMMVMAVTFHDID
jgi:hypothetical protein